MKKINVQTLTIFRPKGQATLISFKAFSEKLQFVFSSLKVLLKTEYSSINPIQTSFVKIMCLTVLLFFSSFKNILEYYIITTDKFPVSHNAPWLKIDSEIYHSTELKAWGR